MGHAELHRHHYIGVRSILTCMVQIAYEVYINRLMQMSLNSQSSALSQCRIIFDARTSCPFFRSGRTVYAFALSTRDIFK